MAKSNIIAEFVSEEISLENALMRIMVLTSKFEDKTINEWAQNEIGGYEDKNNIPNYRVLKGIIIGSYQIWGGGVIQTHSNKRLATVGLTNEQLNSICKIKFSDGVSSLQVFTNDNSCSYPLPMESYHLFEKGTNVEVTDARISISSNSVQTLVSKIKVVTLNILLELEKNFGSLDNLDIDIETKSKKKQGEIEKTLINYIYEDKRIEIGDNNNFTKTNIFNGISDIFKRKK